MLTYTQPAGMNPGLLAVLQQQQQQQISPMLMPPQPPQQPVMTDAMLKTLAAMQPQAAAAAAAAAPQQSPQPAAAAAAATAAGVPSPPTLNRMQDNLEQMMAGAEPALRAQLQQQHSELARLQQAQQPASAAAVAVPQLVQLPLPDVVGQAAQRLQEEEAAAAPDPAARAIVVAARDRGLPLSPEFQMAWEAEINERDPIILNVWKLEERRLLNLKPPRFMPLMVRFTLLR